MTEPVVVSGERDAQPKDAMQVAAGSDAQAPAGYGARLAWERERAGLGVTDVAARLRLHPDQVRAIEQENLARLPEAAYVRGFIRGYARALNIDPLPIVTDLNAKLAPAPAPEADRAGAKDDVERGAGDERSSRWVVGIAVVGLVALGWVGWQTTQRGIRTQTQAPPVATAPVVAPPVVTAPVAPPPTTAAPAADLVPAPITVQAAPASIAAAAPKLAEASPVAVAPAVIATNPSALVPTLFLRFTGASWVEVTDAGGKVLLSQLSTPGAEHALEGELPLSVLIGDATKTSVEVRGVALNLLPIMRNNVARFNVK